MVIAIASGKGGTGKTTVSVALALSSGKPVTLLDCDVEGANDFLFFDHIETGRYPVTVPIPVVDASKCDGCGKCRSLCEYNAIVVVKGKACVYSELCHSCGGCARVCPRSAITETPLDIGTITTANAASVSLVKGELSIGRSMSPPVIRAVKERARRDGLNIIDSPPGTSCPMIQAVKGSDYVILVTEPTPFGLHDLILAVRVIRVLGIPFGVIINRCDTGNDGVERFCEREQIEILMRIPDRRDIAELCSKGIPITLAGGEYKRMFATLLDHLQTNTGVRA